MIPGLITDPSRPCEYLMRPAEKGDVRILFAGDYYGGNRTAEICRGGRYDELYNDMMPVLEDKHLSVVNLESPITSRDNPIVKNGPHLRAHSGCAAAIRFAKFDVVTLANNHIMDHGGTGLFDTLSACNQHGLKTVGAGHNLAEAGKPLIVGVGGLRIGLCNMAEDEFSIAGESSPGANPLDPLGNYYQIVSTLREVDVLIAIVHGGNELYPYPSPRMVRTCRYLADLGVGAVIGHHPHCPTGFSVYRGVPIFYSLGNFIFDSGAHEGREWHRGYLVAIDVRRGGVSRLRLVPYSQWDDVSGARLLHGRELGDFMNQIREYSEAIANPVRLKGLWKDYCRARELFYLKQLLGLNRYDVALLKRGIGTGRIIRTGRLAEMLNYVRCQAHRDVAIESLCRNIEQRCNGK